MCEQIDIKTITTICVNKLLFIPLKLFKENFVEFETTIRSIQMTRDVK